MNAIKKFGGEILPYAIVVGVIFSIGYSFMKWAVYSEKNRPGKQFSIQGQEHIKVGASHDPYNSNPPTSGPHYEQPAEWGVYEKELPDEQLVHNLEHGGIWISYTNISPVIKTELETLAKKYSGSIILTSREKNPAPIILASWGRLEELQDYNKEIIIKFINNNKNKSPEPLAR